MSNRYDLFTDQDLQAFADGEIDGERLDALLQRFGVDPRRLSRTEQLNTINEALLAKRQKIYDGDPMLSKKVRELLDRRNETASPKQARRR